MTEKETNRRLEEISRMIFGEKAVLRVVDPHELVLLQKNARYMKKEVYKQLVDNIRSDEMLSSLPLCHELEDGRLEVLSGNHRVQALKDAGLPRVLVLVLTERLDRERKIAIQLSHNALVGEDDPMILAELWSEISEIGHKLYAGLSSDTVKEIEKIQITTFSTPQPPTKTLSFLFTEPEIEGIEAVLDACSDALASDVVYAAHLEAFEAFFQALRQVKRARKIRNGSLALLALVDLASAALETEGAETAGGDEACISAP